MQLKKLAVLGNACFWLMLVFQFGKWARNIQPDLLNTIVMIGLLAIVINLIWILLFVGGKASRARILEKDEPQKNIQYGNVLFSAFNILSFASQLIFIFFKFL